ncbi:MAG: type II secretion system minor pseudopilin GspK [Candidatus Manganitrophus sp. SA1]|nr:type II secretion system minor pseudopilin GspK [Candidatus Manganitrophus morganii]
MGGSIPEAMRRHNKLLKNEGGFALLLSLLVVLLLTVLILELDFQARADLRAAGNFRDDLKAFYLARSAVSAGEAILKEDLRFSNKYDGLDELWAYPVPEYPLGDGVLSGAITDETGKFNLNSLVDNTGKTAATVQKTRHKQLRRLFELLQLDPELADPIVDWVDIDSDPISAYGAEDESYRRLDPPYSAKNARFDTLEELHMVWGITDDVYRKISPYLTVYGDGLINVNTADSLMIQSLDFEGGIDESIAGRLIENRPYENKQKFIDSVPADVKTRFTTAGTTSGIDTKSNFFSITAEGKVQNTRKIVRAIIRRGNPMELLYFKVE